VAKAKKDVEAVKDDVNDFTGDLIRSLNKEFGSRIAYNLSEDEAPTTVKRWIDTGSTQLNYALRNEMFGGYPEGRVIEISGLPSTGKSHLAYHAASVVQSMGGLVVYVDTENATPIDKLKHMGIDVAKRFVYCDTHCTEEVFSIIESTILKAKSIISKNVPILVIWDSVAATSPKAELDGDYDQNTVGLQARVISKGMRKITGVIGQNNVTLICINQLRTAIGVMHGDPFITPGGKAIPYHSTIQIRLTGGTQIKSKDGSVIGIHVIATVKKNKVAPPHKKMELNIIFGKGIQEHEYVFDKCRSYCEKNKVFYDHTDAKGNSSKLEVKISGTGPWKELNVFDAETGIVVLEKKFYKNDFADIMRDPTYAAFVNAVIDSAYTLGADVEPGEGQSGEEDEDE
jgi:recombination protein RecA